MITIPTKKLASGFELPVYGLGLWGMGGRREVDASNDDAEVAAIRAAVEAGIRQAKSAEPTSRMITLYEHAKGVCDASVLITLTYICCIVFLTQGLI